MKRKVLIFGILLAVIIVLLMLFCVGGKRTDVNLVNYEFSENGTKLKFQVLLSSSVGYVRSFREKQEGKKQYLTFYSTFGINNRWGAKQEFEMRVNPLCEEIYVDKGEEEYRLVFQKDAEGKWQEVSATMQ